MSTPQPPPPIELPPERVVGNTAEIGNALQRRARSKARPACPVAEAAASPGLSPAKPQPLRLPEGRHLTLRELAEALTARLGSGPSEAIWGRGEPVDEDAGAFDPGAFLRSSSQNRKSGPGLAAGALRRMLGDRQRS